MTDPAPPRNQPPGVGPRSVRPHPDTRSRHPNPRIDIQPSSRRVRVEVSGVSVAESSRPVILYEAGLPPRYYLPISDVRRDLLEPSDTVTHCPYKGAARYWSVRVGATLHRDLVWSYPAPLPECRKIAGLVAFYDEQVDLYVDGVRQARPGTRLS